MVWALWMLEQRLHRRVYILSVGHSFSRDFKLSHYPRNFNSPLRGRACCWLQGHPQGTLPVPLSKRENYRGYEHDRDALHNVKLTPRCSELFRLRVISDNGSHHQRARLSAAQLGIPRPHLREGRMKSTALVIWDFASHNDTAPFSEWSVREHLFANSPSGPDTAARPRL